MIRVYVDMVADLFHIGHINLMQHAKTFGNYLIVGVHSDKDVASYKRKPIINEENRYEIVRNCKLADQVIESSPLLITEEFIKKHKIDLVVHGDDISKAINDQHEIISKLGIVRYVPYTKGVSTTEIIAKIQGERE